MRYLMIYVSIYFLRISAAENIKRLTQMSHKKVSLVSLKLKKKKNKKPTTEQETNLLNPYTLS